MVDTPLGSAVEECRRRVEEDGSSAQQESAAERAKRTCEKENAPLDERLVALLRILLRRVPEVTTANRSTDSVVILAARDDVELVPARTSAPAPQKRRAKGTHRSMMPRSCFRTSCARRRPRPWIKFSEHQGLLPAKAHELPSPTLLAAPQKTHLNLLAAQPLYTVKSVR